ncbi:MAG: hypothetical protein FJW88_09665 [Actinobacteria bacterium]|nr:hypothetical protein [Actinomycetota bacterium]
MPDFPATPPVSAAPLPAFADVANAALVAWKARTPTLHGLVCPASPYAGRPNGPCYDVCLPIHLAHYNLLPDARDVALGRFRELGIRWHDGTKEGPSNHLRDSQVQCVNVLAPLVNDPDALRVIFGSVLPIAEVLPFADPGAPDDHLVFEWIGLHDYLGEGGGKQRTRGANTTSADAALRYRAPDGTVEIALVEWKYTERYPAPHPDPTPSATATRRGRYAPLWDRVVRTDVLGLTDLFVEPFYQLLRQQMLAHEMELAGELDADRVRLVYAAPGANVALWSSFATPVLRDVVLPGRHAPFTHVLDLWRALLLEPDRFVWLDTARIVADDAPTSTELKDRYRHLAWS